MVTTAALKAQMDFMSAAELTHDLECLLSVAPKGDREELRAYAKARTVRLPGRSRRRRRTERRSR